MTTPRITSFREFWPYYVGAHKHPINRALHYVGTSCALGCVAAAAVTANPLWLAAAPVMGYGLAWVGHFRVEGNRPATLEYARYSLAGDVKMLWLGVTGRMADEVQRVAHARAGTAARHA